MTNSIQKIKIWNINSDINKYNNEQYKICHVSYINNYIHIIESSYEVPILVYNLDSEKIKEIKKMR